MRAAAKNGEAHKLETLLKGMEIPDCEVWLHKMYDSDKADSWMGLCDPKILGPKEKSMQELFAGFAGEEGEILTRRVNDNPEPGKGMEWGWLQAIKAPLDIYFATWKRSIKSDDKKGDPIGYFMFIDGGFRWESSIEFIKPKISTAKFVPPKLIKKVAPVYPSGAESQHIGGTVRVYYVIGADGAIYNAHAISGDGLSDDLSLRKAAEEAVLQWRYQPATLDGKPIQINAVTVDIMFALKN
jgi:TonB family protein